MSGEANTAAAELGIGLGRDGQGSAELFRVRPS